MKPETKSPAKLVAGAALGFALCAALLMRKTDRLLTPVTPSATTTTQAEPETSPSPSASASPGSTAIDPAVQPPSPRSPEDLVRSSVGRWRGDDGTVIEIDPVRPRIGTRAPFHLVIVRTEKEKRVAYGCDFTDAEAVKKPPDQSERTFRAWCGGEGKGKRSALGITLDAGLSVSLMTDGEWKLTATGLAKQRADGGTP